MHHLLLLLMLVAPYHALLPRFFRSEFFKPDWLTLIGGTLSLVEKLKVNSQCDFTAGAWILSTTFDVHDNNKIEVPMLETTMVSSPLLKVHRFGTSVIKKLPDSALLGFLVLISSELFQREVNYKSGALPPLLQEIANTTTGNLDAKLEKLTSLKWDLDPFLQEEIEDLQTQPLEVVDKYIVKELLPRIDKDLSPLLNKLSTDPKRVTEITSKIKDLVQLGSLVIARMVNKKINSVDETTSTLIQHVDVVGAGIHEAVIEWNRIISDLGKLTKSESVLGLIKPDSFANLVATSRLQGTDPDTAPTSLPDWVSLLASLTSTKGVPPPPAGLLRYQQQQRVADSSAISSANALVPPPLLSPAPPPAPATHGSPSSSLSS